MTRTTVGMTAGRIRRRFGALLAATVFAAGLTAVAPAVVAPESAARAHAAVYECGCPASAYAMLDRWDELGFPRGAGWRQIGDRQWLYGGAVHRNRERQLPTGASYREYDAQVYRSRGQARGGKRIVVDVRSLDAWYSPNHYADFYLM